MNRLCNGLRAASCLLVCTVLSCAKQAAPKPQTSAGSAVKASAPAPEFDIASAWPDAGKPAKDRDEREGELERAVDDYKREHPFADATELLKQEAFLKKLAPVLQAAVKEHHFTERVQTAVDYAAQLREGRVAPGTYRLDLKVDSYTPERTDRLLGVVLSGDPERLVKYVSSEVMEAAVEFSYAGVQNRSSNGVALEANAPKP